MASSLPLTNKPVDAGLSLERPAAEALVFPAEMDVRISQASPGRVLRVLDSFAILRNGQIDSMPAGWYESQKWEKTMMIGAVAPLSGEDTLLAQSGRFDKIAWRWILLHKIKGMRIGTNPRFRKSEPCFWLQTEIADYALLQPHKGFVEDWLRSITGIPGLDTIPEPRRCDPSGSIPSWWDVSAANLWPEAALGQLAEQNMHNASDAAPDEQSKEELAAVQEKSAPQAGPESRAVSAIDVRKPNDMIAQSRTMWELEKDKAPPVTKDFPVSKVRESSERGAKRSRAR